MKLHDLQLGTVSLSPDTLNMPDIGMWAFELDEGKEPRMYVDDAMLPIIGLKEQIAPEATYHAWYDHVDPDSYELVNVAVAKMAAGQHAEVQYPWHHPDGRTIIVRCGGVSNPEYKNGIRIEGTHQDVTEMLHFDEQERVRKLNELSLSLITALSDAYAALYYVEPDTGEYKVITRDDFYHKQVYSKLVIGSTFYADTARNTPSFIYKDDLATMNQMTSKEGIENAFRRNGGNTFTLDYRLLIEGQPVWYRLKAVKVTTENGHYHYVFGIMDASKEKEKEKENEQAQRRDQEIIEILASEYTSVYYIDLTTDELTPYTMNADTESVFGEIFRNGIKYSRAYRMYVQQNIGEDDRKMMLQAGSIGNIMTELRTKKTFITQYRNNEGHYCRMIFVKVGNEQGYPAAVALGFADKDTELRAAMEREQAHKRDTAVISGLSEDFSCVVYVNYDTDDEIHYRFDPMFARNIPGWTTIDKFTDRLNALSSNIMHPDDRQAFWNATRPATVRYHLEKAGSYYVNFRTLIEGKTTYYQAKFVRDEHSAGHVIAGFRNVDTETRRELEALDKAEAANRAKTSFLFNMSHDIRTPMNAVIGFTDMAMRNINKPEKALDSLAKVKHASDMLLALINDILDMSRIESGKVELNETGIDLTKVFNSMSEVMTGTAKRKKIKLTFKQKDIADTNVMMDQPLVNRILVNLISNAIKYTPEGGQVSVTLQQLQGVCDGCCLYRFEIADNGIGMSEEFQKHMFEEFSRESTSTVSGIQGTGLGLALSQKLTTLMGGTITCQSQQGVGSTFYLTLPLRLNRNSIETTKSDNDALADTSDFTGMKALLVEDNELNCEIATVILETAGFVVETAVNGQDAVETLREHDPQYYDFILMDIQMPVMDGYQATRIIRQEMPDLKAAIIALSANAFEEDKMKSRAAGMNDHIAKPIDVQTLIHVLKKHRK